MSILTVKNLSHGFGERAIFDDVSFKMLQGEHIGLVGANGEGKSTFMNIITGKLEPDAGVIEWSKRVRTGYLDQHAFIEDAMTVKDVLLSAFQFLYDMENEMNGYYELMGSVDEATLNNLMEEVGTIQDILTHHDFYNIESKVNEVANGLGIADYGMDTPANSLSGGQKTRVLMGKLLLEKPDILLLDEPTNFLDEEHILWLKKYLLAYEDAFVLISHDIEFLNSVVNIIYHAENQSLDRYVGDYYHFLEQSELKQRQLEAKYKQQQSEIAALEEFVQRNKARVSTRNMAMSRQKKLDKMEKIELKKEKPKATFNFLTDRVSSKNVFETKDLVIGYSTDRALSAPLNLRMDRGEKIAIIGSNGIGKTTLLKSILGIINSLSGRTILGDNLSLAYFEQEIKNVSRKTCIEDYWEKYPSLNQGEVRAQLSKVGLTSVHMESQVYTLSGGEQAKLRLCKLMNTPSNFIVLDEPTNHLDVDSKEALKQALLEFKGTILMISHEPSFYESIATKVWNLEEMINKGN